MRASNDLATVTAALAAVLIMGSASAASIQNPRDASAAPVVGTAVLAGVVTDADHHPLRRVVVTVESAELPGGLQIVSGDDGAFAFGNLPAGRFTLTAERPGYLKTYYGSRRSWMPPGMPVALATGQRKADVAIMVLHGAAIEGVVRDEAGTPLASSQVTALQVQQAGGDRRLVNAPSPWATTDERGIFRVYGLPPGEYTVMANGGGGTSAVGGIRATSGSLMTRLPAYFPGVSEAGSATTFALAAGEERDGVDVVTSLAPAGSMEGLSLGPDGRPLSNVSIELVNESAGRLWISPGAIRPDGQGHWALPVMQPGRYQFVGQAPAGSGPPLWAVTDVTVTGPVTGVTIAFHPAMSVSGALAFQGAAAAPDATGVVLRLTPVVTIPGSAFTPPAATMARDGTFVFPGVAPGRYRLTATVPSPWTIESAVVDGRDTLDAPLEVPPDQPVSGLVVSLTDQPTELGGTLFDALGRPTPEYSIVVFPVDPALWATSPRRLVGPVKLASDGRYLVSGLPAGDYYVSAVTDADRSELTDPSFLETLIPASVRVTLASHEKKTQDLRIGG